MSSVTGMLEMKSSPGISSSRPSFLMTTLSIRRPVRLIRTTALFSRTVPCRRSISALTAFHIMPGPSRG